MPRGKKFTAEQIIGKLHEAEVCLAQGKAVPESVAGAGLSLAWAPSPWPSPRGRGETLRHHRAACRIPDRQRRAGRPQRVVRRIHPVIAMPVLARVRAVKQDRRDGRGTQTATASMMPFAPAGWVFVSGRARPCHSLSDESVTKSPASRKNIALICSGAATICLGVASDGRVVGCHPVHQSPPPPQPPQPPQPPPPPPPPELPQPRPPPEPDSPVRSRSIGEWRNARAVPPSASIPSRATASGMSIVD
jgi:hypothetical protein